jgi:hypothetical protein
MNTYEPNSLSGISVYLRGGWRRWRYRKKLTSQRLSKQDPHARSVSTAMSKIDKDTITKFEAMEKILENLDGKATEVRSSIREVFIMMKMLETRVEQLVGCPMGNKGDIRDNLKVSRRRGLLKLIREKWRIALRPRRSRPKDRSSRC